MYFLKNFLFGLLRRIVVIKQINYIFPTPGSASLDSVTKLFEQVKAIRELNLGRREMLKMLTQSGPSASHQGKCINENPGDDGNDSDGESDIVDFESSM